MPNFSTLEIRWFFRENHRRLKSGFGGLSPEQYTLESRVDAYLHLPGREDLGIKVRQGRLEVKYRTSGPDVVEAAPGIQGMLEGWEKLSFELNPYGIPHILPEDFMASWLKVTKERLVTKVRLADGVWHYYPPGESIPGSVQVEYTGIRVRGMQWYTFGIEWLPGNPPDLAQAVVEQWVHPEGLKETDSMGYPAFIGKLLE